MPCPELDAFPVWIGWDPREDIAFRVARHSLLRHATVPVAARPLVLADLRHAGLYTRPVERDAEGRLRDPISDAPMSTEFAISRFFLPWAEAAARGRDGPRCETGWALFTDSDVLWRRDIAELLALRDDRFAVMVVPHAQAVGLGERKMDGQPQTAYPRKNWSSVMLWNLGHPLHARLSLATLNGVPGRDLHGLRWLDDDPGAIGFLPAEWNWLEGHSDPACDPALVHYTRGGPWHPGWECVEYAGAWLEEAGRMAVAEAAFGARRGAVAAAA